MKIIKVIFMISILLDFIFLGWALTQSQKNIIVDDNNLWGDEKNSIPALAPENWGQIEEFLNLITQEEITSVDEFYLYGYETGYEKVPAESNGYIPFYESEELNIIKNMVPASNQYVRPGVLRDTTKYVVIHNTGMAHPSATAKKVSQSLINARRAASWHFTVDDKEIYQQLDKNEIGWHAGTSEGNNYGIAIEMAVYQGIDFDQAMRNTAKLTAALLIEYHLGPDDVKQHFDFSGKNCPQVLREANRWEEFLNLVTIEYYGQKYLNGVQIKWISLSPNIMDDNGKILNDVPENTSVNYQAEVIYQNQSHLFTFQSYKN